MQEHGKLKCFSRVQIVNQDGSLAGDSGLTGPNQVTNLGLQNFLAASLAGGGGAKTVGFFALGTGGLVASDGTTLPSEVMGSTKRTAVGASAFSSRTASDGSCTQYFYATFASGVVSGAGSNLSNIGLYNATTTNDTLFCGNTYDSSACASNQAVNCTYEIRIG